MPYSDEVSARLEIISYTLFLLLPGGENFQAIRNKYQNQIDVSQMATPERVLVLYGDENRAMSILADALPVMALNQGVRPGFVEVRAMIHSSQAGAVIVSDLRRLIIGHRSFSLSLSGQKWRSHQRISPEVQFRHESVSQPDAGRYNGTSALSTRRTSEYHRMLAR